MHYTWDTYVSESGVVTTPSLVKILNILSHIQPTPTTPSPTQRSRAEGVGSGRDISHIQPTPTTQSPTERSRVEGVGMILLQPAAVVRITNTSLEFDKESHDVK